MSVDFLDPPYIQYSSSSSKVVRCRQSCWLRWSFWQWKCCCTIILRVCPGWINDHFSNQNVSNSCHLFGLSTSIFLGRTEGLTALQHLSNVVNLGYSGQISFLYFPVQFYDVFSFDCIQYRIIACQSPINASRILPYNKSLGMCLVLGFWLHPSEKVSVMGKPGLHSVTMWYDIEYVPCHIGEIGVHWVCCFLLVPPVDNIR